jgi:hypothetical protein
MTLERRISGMNDKEQHGKTPGGLPSRGLIKFATLTGASGQSLTDQLTTDNSNVAPTSILKN